VINFGLLLAWADTHNVRLSLRFIPDQKPGAFVVEGSIPRPDKGKNLSEFVRRRGKTVEDVCGRFLDYVQV